MARTSIMVSYTLLVSNALHFIVTLTVCICKTNSTVEMGKREKQGLKELQVMFEIVISEPSIMFLHSNRRPMRMFLFVNKTIDKRKKEISFSNSQRGHFIENSPSRISLPKHHTYTDLILPVFYSVYIRQRYSISYIHAYFIHIHTYTHACT